MVAMFEKCDEMKETNAPPSMRIIFRGTSGSIPAPSSSEDIMKKQLAAMKHFSKHHSFGEFLGNGRFDAKKAERLLKSLPFEFWGLTRATQPA